MNIIDRLVVIIALIACLTTTNNAYSADATTTAAACWDEGVGAYEARDYAKAVEAFEHIVTLGEASADVYYNLAGAYFKLGQQNISSTLRPFAGGELGRAVLNYHRALRLDPAMEDARYNLDLAVDHTNDTEAVPDSFLTHLWHSLRDMTGTNGWTIASIAMLAIALTLTIVYLLGQRIVLRKVTFFTALVLYIGFMLTTALGISSHMVTVNDTRAVVICNDTTPVHASPDSASKIIRQPSQGVTLEVLRSHGEWSEILFADGEKGWIRTSQIENI